MRRLLSNQEFQGFDATLCGPGHLLKRNEPLEDINDKKAYLLQLSDKLRQKEFEIDRLKERVNAAEDDIRTDLLKEINGLSMKKETVRSNIKQLQEARDDMWDDIKGGLEKSWIELRDTFPMVYSKLR